MNPIVDYVQIWCATNTPIRLTPAAIATLGRELTKEAVAHNLYGEKHCGWKP